ncbi:hypothetical protein HJG60_010037 [Phyllostomus discolor]|uniref:Uncharacterized protein n=1 Tax=Phyllostomus discolor TaxID=89673 RepID=A0A834B0W4_9CHIR|nr:hypothetical protein HJG60_010037 [Phyllostomus discolor]
MGVLSARTGSTMLQRKTTMKSQGLTTAKVCFSSGPHVHWGLGQLGLCCSGSPSSRDPAATFGSRRHGSLWRRGGQSAEPHTSYSMLWPGLASGHNSLARTGCQHGEVKPCHVPEPRARSVW